MVRCDRETRSSPITFFFPPSQGTVKKIGPLKIIHERFKGNRNEDAMRDFHAEFDEAIRANKDIKPHLNKAQDDLNPLRVMNLFKSIPHDDVELLDMNPKVGRPERMLITHLLVPPVCIRPSVVMDAQGRYCLLCLLLLLLLFHLFGVLMFQHLTVSRSNEDDLTVKLMEIIAYNGSIRENLQKGAPINSVIVRLDNNDNNNNNIASLPHLMTSGNVGVSTAPVCNVHQLRPPGPAERERQREADSQGSLPTPQG